MQQHLYEPDHDAFRDLCRRFLTREAVPHHDRWETDGIVDRDVWRAAGAAGLLGIDVDETYGGGGQQDFRYNAVLVEEIVDRRLLRARLRPAQRRGRAIPHRTDHRRAAHPLAARILLRRPGHRHRDERTGRRLRPGRHPHQRRPRRRQLPAQRAENVHHQRRTRRPRHRGRPHRRPGRARGQPDRGRDRHPRLHPRPAAGQGRPESQRHRRTLLRRLPGTGEEPASAPRTTASTT